MTKNDCLMFLPLRESRRNIVPALSVGLRQMAVASALAPWWSEEKIPPAGVLNPSGFCQDGMKGYFKLAMKQLEVLTAPERGLLLTQCDDSHSFKKQGVIYPFNLEAISATCLP